MMVVGMLVYRFVIVKLLEVKHLVNFVLFL